MFNYDLARRQDTTSGKEVWPSISFSRWYVAWGERSGTNIWNNSNGQCPKLTCLKQRNASSNHSCFRRFRDVAMGTSPPLAHCVCHTKHAGILSRKIIQQTRPRFYGAVAVRYWRVTTRICRYLSSNKDDSNVDRARRHDGPRIPAFVSFPVRLAVWSAGLCSFPPSGTSTSLDSR